MKKKYKRKKSSFPSGDVCQIQIPRPSPRLANDAGEEHGDMGKWVGLVFLILFVGFWIYWGLTFIGVFPPMDRGGGWVP